MIQKGVITSVNVADGTVRVESADKTGDITRALNLQDGIDITTLEKGQQVVYVIFEDLSGVVLSTI